MSDSNHTERGHPHPDSKDSFEKAGYQDQGMQSVHSQLMREQSEPTELTTPMPTFLMVVFGALLFWGGLYLALYSGGFRFDVFDHNYVPGAAASAAPAVFDPITRGSRVFRNRCAVCHQSDGQGQAGVFPSLVGTPWVTGSEERVVKILLYGLQGEIEVNGRTYNGNMPAFGPSPGGLNIGDRDISAVLTFIRQEWGNSADPITEEQVAAIREGVGDRSPWDGNELLSIHPMQ